MYRKFTNKELAAKAAQLTALQEEAATLSARIDAIKAEITGELDRREAEELNVPGYLIRWTRYVSSRFDSRAFKAEHPDLSREYTRPAESRRFSLCEVHA